MIWGLGRGGGIGIRCFCQWKRYFVENPTLSKESTNTYTADIVDLKSSIRQTLDQTSNVDNSQ